MTKTMHAHCIPNPDALQLLLQRQRLTEQVQDLICIAYSMQ